MQLWEMSPCLYRYRHALSPCSQALNPSPQVYDFKQPEGREPACLILERGGCNLEVPELLVLPTSPTHPALQEWLNIRGAKVPFTEKVTIAACLMHAVAALHKKNLAWTDLKPANFVMIVSNFGAHWKAIDMDSVIKVNAAPWLCGAHMCCSLDSW